MADLTVFSSLLSEAPHLGNIIGKLIYALYEGIGNFGWTVVVFTLIVKLITLPLDIWQKHLGRKNAKAMKRMKPKLEKLQKQCGNDRALYSQKQMALYKEEGYSMLGVCLPTIVTLVIFFVIFSGFNATVRYYNETIAYELADKYNEMIVDDSYATSEEQQIAIDEALTALYEEKLESWLWIKNVFMPDTWQEVIPDHSVYSGSGMGKLNAADPDNLNVPGGYDALVSGVSAKYNKSSFWDIKKWNGYLILPLLSIVLNFFVSKLTAGGQQPDMPGMSDAQAKSQANTMKIMQYMMPAMIGIFSLLYSAAFTIYLFFSSLISIIFQIVYNAITKRIDAKEEDAILSRTFRR